MCGIAGYIGKKKLLSKTIISTLKIMENRGPDNQDYFFYRNKENLSIYLLSSRLSIVDLNSSSNQPFTIGNYTIVYNGEVYNHLELKKKLIQSGIKFRTNSDTEVILQYFILYKENCVKYFEGMWAFAIYNKDDNKIFFSRDRFGEKPFYYLENEDGFYFGSEIQYIQNLSNKKIHINTEHLLDYLSLGYKSLYKKQQNFFLKIQQLDSASNIYFDVGKKIIKKKYWKLNFYENKNLSIEDSIFGVRERTIKSIDLRVKSNVPTALCLSGGIDSGIIASVIKKILNKNIKTFSIIDSDKRYNEKDNILEIIKDTNLEHEFIYLNKNNRKNNFQKLINLVNYHNAPIATISFFLQSLMLEKINKQGFKVALLGTAADEIFAGYYDHYLLHLAAIKNLNCFNKEKDFFLKYNVKNIRNHLLKDPYKYINHPSDRGHIYDESEKIKLMMKKESKSIFIEHKYCNDILRNRMLNELFFETTPVILNEDDLNSMFYSIENRSPYLDRDLVEFAYTIPTKYLINDGYNKYILRNSFKNILSKKILKNRKKIGFNSSIDTNFDLNNKEIKNYLLDKKSAIFEFVNIESIKKIYNKKNKENYLSKFLFNFINAKIFLDKNL
jgi:asparagine synthase (glutamine-hydrolysing)